MRLTQKEIDMILDKIKKKYDEYASKYGKEFFSYKSFKDRYYQYLKSRSDIEIFLYAEIQALEDRVKEIEEKREKRKKQEEIKKYFDNIENKILDKIKNYPELEDVSDRVRYEIRKLAGAIKVIYPILEEYFYFIKREFQDEYRRSINVFKDFVLKPFSGRFSEYLRNVSNPFFQDNKYLEKMEQDIIKDWGIAINNIYSIFKDSKIDNEEVKEFLKILEKIIEDFRLTVFNQRLKI
ncbi:MAG TPA: hypothetical protein PKW55_05730 [Spirochaetota bacterium]|nr:hypothetical protein [Spirochaetota bacterium]HOM37548.1 hypothetical protein [Spirochaetota bacterium]HPQ49480.1 hypothetical protein [Spirochaetota bacterium]